MTDYGSVASAALSLSETERADLAARLLDSLDGTCDEGVEEAWQEEVRRRAATADQEGVPSVPWTEVKAALLRQAAAHDAH